MQKCTRCGDKISGEEISEWRAEHEAFSMHPLICPDCWDNLQRKDLEDQFEELMEVTRAERKKKNDENRN